MLPIVHREMLAAARRRGTFVFRTLACAATVAVTSIEYVVSDGDPNTARNLFWCILIAGALFAALAGAFRAAHTLSAERAQGTLGLLFLTPLNGFDVALGKFATASLMAFQIALGLAPLLAVTLLFGGISIPEVIRGALWLGNVTFFFMSVSLLISALTGSETAAAGWTFAVIVAATLGAFNVIRFSIFNDDPMIRIEPISIVAYIPDSQYIPARSHFWIGLLISHLIAWTCLLGAGKALSLNWRKERVFPRLSSLWVHKSKPHKTRAPVPDHMGPLQWLVLRNAFPNAPLILSIIVLFLAILVWRGPFADGAEAIAMFNLFPILMGIAEYSIRAVAEGRKSGFLDGLAIAPISDEEIVRGEIRALQRMFFLPAIVAIACYAASLSFRQMRDLFPQVGWPAFASYTDVLTLALMMWASAYTGIWLALHVKNPTRALFANVFFVLILPWFLPAPPFLYLLILGGLARRIVSTQFRELLAGDASQPSPGQSTRNAEMFSKSSRPLLLYAR